MDKELLRIIIIATGAVVIVGIILWSFFQNKKSRRRFVFRDDGNALNNIDQSLIINTADDDFDIVPLGSAVDESENEFAETVSQEAKQVVSQQTKQQLPKIIQLSLVAKAEDGFNGLDLVAAFDAVGLQYGSMQIFERIDANNQVDFGVASMVEPGTFPEHDLHTFNCPGIAFFMQPQEVDNPLAVFDDFIETLHALSFKLDGVEWDAQRHPLSEEHIQAIRNSLQG